MSNFLDKPQINQADYLSVSFAAVHNVGAGGVSRHGGVDVFLLVRRNSRKRFDQCRGRMDRALGHRP